MEFVQDMHLLNIKQPDILARVTEFIPEIKHFIQNLIEKDLAYSSVDGSIYFDTTKYNKYGKFVKVPDIVSNSIKKSSLDFALWKAAKPGEPFWDSCWGPGRPGWHIECSAIASYYFGSNVDLHSGGIDLLFPHHENEEAQCCAYHDVDNWVENWIYTGHLHLGDNVKMSKSLKNTVSVKEVLKTYTANEFRVLCLLSNYKNDVEFNEQSMEMARKTLNKFESFLFNCSSHLKNKQNVQAPKTSLLHTLTETESEVLNNLADNFDTSKALQSLICLMNAYNKYFTKDQRFDCSSLEVMLASNIVSKTLDNLGVDLVKTNVLDNSCNIGLVIDLIVDFRTNLRQLALNSGSSLNKQDVLKLCDLLRNDMSSVNIKIQDSNKYSVWTYSEAIPKELQELTES
ncbi:probable cysteine--tRNA ligase, mitochondrial isoform X2 [Adelges cooleyi]|nr:probable cysteine--tRNA ligase, mitochondrial isoform X2 [Adelges cooleyi]XP_050428757.1 probable cysteine--tRNA ligase, mitochondrial isoform X2 [Adelges cooleyi]